MPKMIDDERTRQGSKGKPVFLVLVGSFVLIGIYLLSMLLWAGSEAPDSASQDAARQKTQSSSSSSNASRTPSANPAYPAPASPTASPSATGTAGSPGAPGR